MQHWLWLPLALGSAAFAALVAIFGKMGLQNVNTVAATFARSLVMTLVLALTAVATGGFGTAFSLRGKTALYVVLAGVAGALSWLCYFLALKAGKAGQVAAVDRFSVVLAIALAAMFLGEDVTPRIAIGAGLITVGAVLVALG